MSKTEKYEAGKKLIRRIAKDSTEYERMISELVQKLKF